MIRYILGRFLDDDGKMVGELRYRTNMDTVALGHRMAAADDMLDALKKADAWVAQYHDMPGHDAASRQMSAVIRAAIAKATEKR